MGNARDGRNAGETISLNIREFPAKLRDRLKIKAAMRGADIRKYLIALIDADTADVKLEGEK